MIAVLNDKKIKASFVFEGSCERTSFEIYLTNVLFYYLRKGQTVIMDNASFHKGGRIEEIINRAGCELIYLPTYSPDLNPIEHYWAHIKNRIKKFLATTDDIYQAANQAFAAFRS